MRLVTGTGEVGEIVVGLQSAFVTAWLVASHCWYLFSRTFLLLRAQGQKWLESVLSAGLFRRKKGAIKIEPEQWNTQLDDFMLGLEYREKMRNEQ